MGFCLLFWWLNFGAWISFECQNLGKDTTGLKKWLLSAIRSTAASLLLFMRTFPLVCSVWAAWGMWGQEQGASSTSPPLCVSSCKRTLSSCSPSPSSWKWEAPGFECPFICLLHLLSIFQAIPPKFKSSVWSAFLATEFFAMIIIENTFRYF